MRNLDFFLGNAQYGQIFQTTKKGKVDYSYGMKAAHIKGCIEFETNFLYEFGKIRNRSVLQPTFSRKPHNYFQILKDLVWLNISSCVFKTPNLVLNLSTKKTTNMTI